MLFVVAFMPFPTKLVAEALHDLDTERRLRHLYGLTLFTIRLLIAALDGYARRACLYSQERADEDLQTRTTTALAGPRART